MYKKKAKSMEPSEEMIDIPINQADVENSDSNPTPANEAATDETLTQRENASSENPVKAPASQLDPLEELKSQYADLNDKFLRLAADYQNFRKRTQKERLELRDRYHQDVLEDILPVLDNFDLALNSVPENEEARNFAEGIILVDKQLHEILNRYGLKEIESVGKPFDPNYHEAMMTVDSQEHPDQTVLEEIRKGYIKDEKVVRHSLVKVSIKSEPENK